MGNTAILLIDEAEKMKAFIPFSTMMKVWDAKDNGKFYINVSEKSLASWRKKYEVYNHKFNILLPRCVEYNNLGISYEKQGSIKAAIDVYEKNILPDSYPEHHAYDRLLVIYRRQKDYTNEERVCKLAISTFPKEMKYKERLKKVEQLINKQL